MQIVFFGMLGQFSTISLAELLAGEANICAVVIPANQTRKQQPPRLIEPQPATASTLPIIDPYLERNIVHLAWAHQIPVWEVGSLANPATLALMTRLQPDVINVACFPYIFPPALLELPRYGCLNLHPSLLPAYRGPAPLFWIARQDERLSGVTLHFLDRGVDSGDIVAQASFERPDGISETELERRCAEAGAALLLEAIRQLDQGKTLPRQPQPESQASYFPWPGEADYVVPTRWSARRAFNFLRGAAQWPLRVEIDHLELYIRIAISYSSEQTLTQSYFLYGDEAWIQFQPGVVRAKVYLPR
jgi:methionyl-tRNA formyltransferase